MKVNVLQTFGKGEFVETVYDKPDPAQDEIEVQAVMTGVCRSDIDMMLGDFQTLPIHMQGHEGLGIVTKVGNNIQDVKLGDYVATRGEPAYADFYNAKMFSYVKVPELHQRYIIEPVACGVNIVMACIREIAERSGRNKRLLIVGSGFLAYVAYKTLKLNHLDFDIDVLGSHNLDIWGDKLLFGTSDVYDVVIDLSSGEVYDNISDNALLILAAGKDKNVGLDINSLLWKSANIMLPSPRNLNFHMCMRDAARWIENGDIVVDKFWSKGYNRYTEWQQAFADGVNRPANYSRGYLYWQH